jgi:hypothetical protein
MMMLLFFLQAAALPGFDQFRVPEAFRGKPAAPVLTTGQDREFRTRIREGAAAGPNFAGHYTIADWGCGAGCVSLAVVDAADGKVYRAPFRVLGWQMVKFEGKLAADDDKFEPLSYQKQSRLLIARGCPEEKNCGSYFYEWTGTQFKLLRQVPAAPLPQ